MIQMRTLGGQHDDLYVEGVINDTPCKMLIDTGTSVSIISPKMLQVDGCTVNISPVQQLRTATGDCTPVHGCVTFDVTIGGYSGRHQMLVADIIDCCILGLDFLESCHCMLDLVGHVLQLQGMQIKLVPRTAPMCPMCQRIVTTERIEIKAGEDAVLSAGLTSNGRHVDFGVIEGNHRTIWQRV